MPTYGQEEIQDLTQVTNSGGFCDKSGGFVDRFGSDFAPALGAKEASTGATAMLLMQAIPGAIGAGAGDEIIFDPVGQFHGICLLEDCALALFSE